MNHHILLEQKIMSIKNIRSTCLLCTVFHNKEGIRFVVPFSRNQLDQQKVVLCYLLISHLTKTKQNCIKCCAKKQLCTCTFSLIKLKNQCLKYNKSKSNI